MTTIKKLIFAIAVFAAPSLSAQQITKADLKVTGLTCSMCSQATEKSLKTLDFIGTITPDLNKNIFVIEFKKDKNVNLDLLKKKVEDAGFSIGTLMATMHFNQVKTDAEGKVVAGGTIYKFMNAKNRTLNGPIKVEVVDKGFVSAAAFKQKSKAFGSDTYASGAGLVNGRKARIYHLSL